MTLRIVSERASGVTIVRLEGHLRFFETTELQRACVGLAGPVVVDLAGLVDADLAGLLALRELRERGIQLANPTLYLAMCLEEQP